MFNIYLSIMRVGDKVRMLKDTIQGVVIRVINEKEVEIEDEFGFGMPVLISDLVLVSPMEDKYFKDNTRNLTAPLKTDSKQKPSSINASKGLYMGVVEEHKNYAIYLANNTNTKHFINVFSKKGEDYRNLHFDVLGTKTAVRIGLYPLSDIDTWSSVFIGFQAKSSDVQPFSQVAKKINLSKLKKSPQDIPLVESKGICFQLDDEVFVDKMGLEMAFNDSSSLKETKVLDLKKPKAEVDLHSEVLGIKEDEENHVILGGQINAFEKSIESAIAHGMSEITFIHGVGNGKLRMEIHKRIKNYSEVKYFEDANQTRFGYGATKIVFTTL